MRYKIKQHKKNTLLIMKAKRFNISAIGLDGRKKGIIFYKTNNEITTAIKTLLYAFPETIKFEIEKA